MSTRILLLHAIAKPRGRTAWDYRGAVVAPIPQARRVLGFHGGGFSHYVLPNLKYQLISGGSPELVALNDQF